METQKDKYRDCQKLHWKNCKFFLDFNKNLEIIVLTFVGIFQNFYPSPLSILVSLPGKEPAKEVTTKKKEKDFVYQKLTHIQFTNVDLCLSQGSLHPFLATVNFDGVVFIEFHDCQITHLTDEFFNLLSPNLWHLSLIKNDIICISNKISRLKELSYLYLDGNKHLTDDSIPWNDLPPSITVLQLLETSITKIPAEIGKLKILQQFKASSDRLKVSIA